MSDLLVPNHKRPSQTMSYQLLPRDTSSPIPQPISTSISSTRRRGFLAFFGTAVATGVIFHLILFGFGATSSDKGSLGPSNIKDWWSNSGDSPLDVPPSHIPGSTGDESDHGRPLDVTCPLPPTANDATVNLTASYVRPGLGQYVVADEDEWTMDRIRKMVEGTKGYYVRDYSLGLGWNNVRYVFNYVKLCCAYRYTYILSNRCVTSSRPVFCMPIFSTERSCCPLLCMHELVNGTC